MKQSNMGRGQHERSDVTTTDVGCAAGDPIQPDISLSWNIILLVVNYAAAGRVGIIEVGRTLPVSLYCTISTILGLRVI